MIYESVDEVEGEELKGGGVGGGAQEQTETARQACQEWARHRTRVPT